MEQKRYEDNRGYFSETYSKGDFEKEGLEYNFVQDNQSYSTRGVLRGLHFQKEFPQAKLVRVARGSVYDVAVDLRKNSDTFGNWFGIILTSENDLQLLIPRGFAHGFQVLSEDVIFCYKCDDFYHPGDEGGIIWNDETLKIEWPSAENAILSMKDQSHPTFKELFN